MALLVLACAAGCRVEAVHVDHGLRPGSADEAGVVADAAASLGATFVSERVDVTDGPNLEARARAARYGVLRADVATGHTMDDQAETVLANLLRGSGADGVAAMAAGPTHPILGLRRTQTEEICALMGLSPVADPSNEDPRHLRNRIRNELLPLCADLAGRDPVPLLARTAELCGDDASFLDAVAGALDPTNVRELSAAPLVLSRRAVRRWLRDAPDSERSGGRRGTSDRHPPSLAEVDRVLSVAAGERVATEISGGRRVRRRAGRLAVVSGLPGKVGAVHTEEAARRAPTWAGPDVGAEVVSAETIAARTAQLGAEITADYADEPPLLVGVLKGAMLFMSDLCRTIELPVDVDFMAVSSYGSATRTSGVVRIVKDLDAELTNRHVLVVEDIIDSGLTLNYLRKYLQAREPKSVEVCALLVKEGEQRVELDLRYVGFTIPSTFVVGYGLDIAERYRNLGGVHIYVGPEATA